MTSRKYLLGMGRRKRKRSAAQIAADKLRTGRPPKQEADRLSRLITVRLTPEERERLGKLAAAEGIPLAELIMRPWREKGDNDGGSS